MSLNIKQQPAWLQLVIFGLITILLAFLGSGVGLFIIAKSNHMGLMELAKLTAADFAKPEFAGIAKALLVVQFFAIFLFPSLLFAFLADSKPFAFAGLKKPDQANFIALGIVIILASYIMVLWLGNINQVLVKDLLGKSARAWIEKSESDVDGTLQNILMMKNGKDLFVAIVLVGILAAVGEELFFRGILQRIMIQAFRSPWIGIIVTAALFSAIHGQFLGFIPRMILGIVLGALYWYSGSLLPAMAGHFVFNGLQVVLVYYKVIDTNSNFIADRYLAFAGIVSLIIVVALLNYLRKRSLTTYDGIYKVPT
jgi:membrane protease YdiL (CAAX protease family)